MNTIIEITTANGQFYYDLFYFLAIAFAGVFFMIDGKRKKYPLVECTLIFSSGIIFLIIGTKLFAYTPNEWKEIVSSFTFPYIERKRILGGIVGGIIGIWIAKKLLRFPYTVLDSFAVSFPIAMGIQRIGCFLVGCCYGKPTNVPWAVTYSYHAMPFYVHLNRGLIDDTSCMSLPIHPNQLYQTLLCLLIAIIVWKLNGKIKRQGNLFFTSIILYWIARFIVEFWRDGETNGIAGNIWMGLKYLQWGLLGAILLMSLFIFIREKKFIHASVIIPSLRNPVWYFIVLSLFVLMLSNWFTKTEFLFIVLVLLPITILQLNKMLKPYLGGFIYRLATVYALFFILLTFGVLSAQKAYHELTKDKSSRNRFNDVSFGYGNFQYSHYHSRPYEVPIYGQGCDGGIIQTGSYITAGPRFPHNSNAFGGGIKHTETYGEFQKLSISAEISAGWDTDKNKNPRKTVGIYDFAPFVQYDFRWLGAGIGFHSGSNLSELSESYFSYLAYNNPSTLYNYSANSNPTSYFNWSGNIRFFPYDIFYAELRINEMFPYQIGHKASNSMHWVYGSGFGFKNGSGVEFCNNFNGERYFSAKAFLYNKYGIKATIFFHTDENTIQMMQFSVLYRLNQKHWNKTPIEKL